MQAGIPIYKQNTLWYLPPIPEDSDLKPYELIQVSGPLGLWTIGTAVGIIIFIIELCINKKGNILMAFC